MKKKTLLITLFSLCIGLLYAQNTPVILDNDSLYKMNRKSADALSVSKDTLKKGFPAIYGWTISQRFGNRTIVERDTAVLGFYNSTLMEGKDIAVSHLGNIGSPAQSKIFFNREESSLFNFLNSYSYSILTPEKKVFLNTKAPYSNIFYQSGGSSLSEEERFTPILTWNVNKKMNIGMEIDYLYARGYYKASANKQIAYNIFASYIDKKYEMHALVYNNNFLNTENGGIMDDTQITDPEKYKAVKNTLNIPVFFGTEPNAWNRVKGRQVYVNNRYNLGVSDADSIPVASLILTTYYADQQRKFVSDANGNGVLTNIDSVYYTGNNFGYSEAVDDRMAYWSLKNTFGVSMNEGFRKWVKFGLTLFVEQDVRRFQYLDPKVSIMRYSLVENQNSTVVGGVLSKSQGKFLRYNLSADLGVLGYNLGEFKLDGNLKTLINIKGKELVIGANAYVKNLKPTFFENKFHSKYFSWDKNFSDTRRVYVGGEIYLPQTKTRIKGGVENLQNYIYYGSDKGIAQESGSFQVLGFELDQRLNAGILHWDNKIAYQVSSNTEVLPLPMLSVFSNLYLQTLLSKVLTLQLGVDAHFFTEYYAPGYDPVLLQFYNQRTTKIGNFPITTAYVNLNLKNTRFFVMMYNVANGVGNGSSFTTPHYPINPSILKWGLSWNFSN